MPGFNQTGPMGQGSMTGRKMGPCSNLGANLKNQSAEGKETANENPTDGMIGRGFGFGRRRGGRGFGMGRKNRFRGGF